MFVNGVATSAIGHAQAALSLCQITRGRVLGVYNESGSIFAGMSYEEILTRVYNSDWVKYMAPPNRLLVQGCITACLPIVRRYPKVVVDLLQCTMDFTRIMFESWTMGLWKPVAAFVPQIFYECIRIGLEPNLAAQSMFVELYNSTTRYPILAYSQGNLVTSSALWGLSLFDLIQVPKLAGIKVFAVASPAPRWPPSIVPRTYAHTDDPVSWLGMYPNRYGWKEDYSGGYVDIKSHYLETYLQSSRLAKDLRAAVGIPLNG